MFGKRLSFWAAVGGVSLLSQFAIQLVADKTNSTGLKSFVNYLQKGA